MVILTVCTVVASPRRKTAILPHLRKAVPAGGIRRTQADIARELGLDSGNFSKTLNRWIQEGIVIRVGEKREARPLHVYPLPEALIKKGTKK